MGGFNLQQLMSQAKQQYESLQKKMQETTVEASAGGGTVHVKMDGRKQVLSLKIDPEAVKAGDLEMLQDLITAAVNEAGRQIDQAMQSTVGGMLGGMGLGYLSHLVNWKLVKYSDNAGSCESPQRLSNLKITKLPNPITKLILCPSLPSR